MKTKMLPLIGSVLAVFPACSNTLPDEADKTEPPVPPATCGTLTADGNDAGTYELIRRAGYNYEVPDTSREHRAAPFRHIRQVYDKQLNGYAFSFFIHAAIDDDRGLPGIDDRQRNEIKTDNKSPESLVAQAGETMAFRWKFRLSEGFRTTAKFSHLHQLKGIDNRTNTADVGSPLVTLTAYSGSQGRQELRIRYDKRGAGTATIASADLAGFLGNWVEVEEKVRFGEKGSYEVTITRLHDRKILLKFGPEEMDMWRTNCTGMRPKWGIYRYLGESRSWQEQLRDEEIRFADFSIRKLDSSDSWVTGGLFP